MPKERNFKVSESSERQELLNFPVNAQIVQRRTNYGKLYVPLPLSEEVPGKNVSTADGILEEPLPLQELPAGDEATPFGNQQNRKKPSPTLTHTANDCKLTPAITTVTLQAQTSPQQYQQQPLHKSHKQMTAKRKNSNSNEINNTATSEAPPANTTTNTTATVTNARANSGTITANNGPSPLATAPTTRREPHISTSSNGEDETDVIGDLVGHFGKWQCLMTMLLSLFQVPNTFHISSSVYQAINKNFWCSRPPHLQNLPVDVWRNLSDSQDNCFQAKTDWSQVGNDSLQLQPALQQLIRQQQQSQDSLPHDASAVSAFQNYLLSPLAVVQNDTRIPCTAWEYDANDNLGNTWTSQWDLVCDKEYIKNVAEMFFLLGVATGGILSGYLSDKFGRKKMLFVSAVLQTIFGLVLYFPKSLEMFLLLRALLGLVSVSVTYAGLILAIEYVDGKWRTIAGMYNLFPLPISYMLIAGIAYLTQDYQRLQLCIGLPGIFLCFLWFVVPESPRWLLVKGRIADVKSIVERAAKFNGRQLPPDYESMLKPPPQEDSSQNCISLFNSGYLRCVTICFLCIWFTMNLVYYGLILNMSSFGGNVYLNSALAGLVEIPAIAIAMYIITKVGKKWLFCATFFCTSIACCCAAITEGNDDQLWLKITFLMIGKFTISAGNTIMPVYTAELYPTAIRNVGVGACNVAAGAALILTPYLSLLNKIEIHFMMTLLTTFAFFGGFVVLFLPETISAQTKTEPREEKC
ncbi:organic cation transporter protein isoform X1 [Bactrocera oleae]|uniref:organic cation transporter protein isoform X1 n=1 Tax=Bactrocera oleae TaxID=104688 RepID=UPI00387E4D92